MAKIRDAHGVDVIPANGIIGTLQSHHLQPRVLAVI
jgi:hypothetical protein